MAVDPIGAGLTQGRVDQGVDYSGSGPLYAVGAGQIVNTHNSGWPNNTFLVLKLNQAINGQQYVYYAEDLTPSVKVGDTVTAGQQIATANGGSSGIELGFANPNLGQAAAAGTFTGDNATPLGQEFLNLIQGAGKSGQGGTGGTGPSGTGNTGTDTQGNVVSSSIGSMWDHLRELVHAVAVAIDYAFAMFEPGQGFRALFLAGAVVAGFVSFKILGSSGAEAKAAL